MKEYYLDGIKVLRPNTVKLGNFNCYSPSDAQITEAGYEIREVEVPQPTPYIPTYEEKVVQLIRERYSIDDELAIQRQRDSKPQEFAEYNAFCEECKQKAKAE